MQKNSFKLLLLTGVTITLAGCQTSGSSSISPEDERSNRINAALERAAISAERSGNANKSLSFLENRYKRRPNDEQAAIDYAASLRKNDYLNRAEIILAPFANDKKASAASQSEMAAILLAQGKYRDAENYAQRAIITDEDDFEAYHRLGIALDAQGEHEKAERAFRKGLELWEGNPTTIMNNLALNLASQNYLDEAAEILQKARTVSPGRTEIERNLRIITALQQSHGIPVPKPGKKPEI